MKTLLVQVKPDSMGEVVAFVEKELEEVGCEHKTAMKFMIAVDEIYSNILYYSGADTAEISIDGQEKQISLIFADNGRPYNPLDRAAPDVTLKLSERIPGGMGIYIVRNSMDQMTYRYQGGRNILTLSHNRNIKTE